ALDSGLAAFPPGDQSALGLLMRFRRAHLALAMGDGTSAVRLLHEARAMLDSGQVGASPRPNLPFLKLPTRVNVLQPLAQAYAIEGDNAKAIECLQAAKTQAPYDRGLYTELAELYFRQGQLGAALVALDELISHYQDSGQI